MATKQQQSQPVDPKVAAREQLAAEHPDSWIPVQAGDSVTGTMIDLDIVWSDVKGGEYPLITLQLDDGREVKVHAMSAALYGEVERKQPLPGERMTFSYHGQGEAKQRGRSGAHIYRLRIEGRSPEAVTSMYDRMRRTNRGQAAAQPDNGHQAAAPPPPAPGGDDEDIPF